VLLRYRSGTPAVVSRKKAGEGEVLLFATPVNDAGWGRPEERRLFWFVSPPFVSFMQEVLQYLTDGRPVAHNRTAGEALAWPVSQAEAGLAFDLVRPDGSRTRLGAAQSEGSLLVVTAPGTETAQAGVYRIVAAEGESEGAPFAVVPDLRETEDLTTFTAEQLDERLGFRATHLIAGDEGSAFLGTERLRGEWTVWLLAGLLVLVLAESLLAWFVGRAW
jgi:hypothetical protein